jgi:hypothetical protein
MERSHVPPNWANLVKNSREKVTEEDYSLAKMWLFPEAEVGDITMQDTLTTTTTGTPDRQNNSTLVLLTVPFESRPLLNSGPFESSTITGISDNNNDSIPRPSLNPVTILAPSLLTGNMLSAPPLINLEMSGLHHSPRIAAELTNANSTGPDIVAYTISTKQSKQMRPKPQLSFLSVFNSVGSFWTFATRDTHSKKEQFSYVAQILHDLDRLNGLFDDTINNICHQIHAFTTSDNECYTYSQMLRQNDYKQFFQAMENKLEDHETRKHYWTLMLGNNMPPGAKTIMAIWSFKRKRFLDGLLNKHKAQLCAHGGQQTWGHKTTGKPMPQWLLGLVFGYFS